MQKGTGKLYDSGGKQVIATINYQIWEKPQTEYTLEEWGGELTLDYIIQLGEYIIELEDGRKRNIIITSIGGQPGTSKYYPFLGSGRLA